MSEILLEIDEALRNQRIKQFWDQYGQWVIGLIIAVILATAIGAYWHAHVTKILGKQTAELLTMLQDEAESNDTTQRLAELSPNTRAPLNALVDLYHAQKLEQKGDMAQALDAYKAVIDNKSAVDVTRDLARVHYTRLGLVTDADLDSLLAVIDPVAKPRATFKGSAMELKGLILVKQGKTDKANAIFTALSNDETIPTSLRNRAKTMIVYGEAK